jgi:hypothetical protein
VCFFFETRRLSRSGLPSLKLLIKILEAARRLLLRMDDYFSYSLATSAKLISVFGFQ